MSNTVSADLATLTTAVTTLTATQSSLTTAITNEGSTVASAVSALQGISTGSGGSTLTAADQAALDAAIANLGTVNTNLGSAVTQANSETASLAAAIPQPGTTTPPASA